MLNKIIIEGIFYMSKNNEQYKNEIQTLKQQIAKGINNTDEMIRVTRQLIRAYIHTEQYNEAKTLLRKYFNFNRKDLLISISDICFKTNDITFAEELIGEIRCYSYTWLDFCVNMQKLYTKFGDNEKAISIQQSIIETAYLSIAPATRALYESLKIGGCIMDSDIIRNLHKELKRIHKEHL